MNTERIARSFTAVAVAWALLIPYGFYMMATTHAGTGMYGIVTLALRAVIAAAAVLLARSVRRGEPIAPPAGAAVALAVVALLAVVVGIGKAVSPHSSLGFLHFGGDESVGASLAFPEMYWARYADSPGPSQGFALFAAIALVAVSIATAVRVRGALSR